VPNLLLTASIFLVSLAKLKAMMPLKTLHKLIATCLTVLLFACNLASITDYFLHKNEDLAIAQYLSSLKFGINHKTSNSVIDITEVCPLCEWLLEWNHTLNYAGKSLKINFIQLNFIPWAEYCLQRFKLSFRNFSQRAPPGIK
jgi:hypothetical protein